MITLVTGGPGTGKTAWLLAFLLSLLKLEPNKLLYIHGVRNLRGIRHEQIYCRSQLCDICRSQDPAIAERSKSDMPPLFVEDWPRWKQPDSLIVVDEVQRIWRPMNGSSQIPEGISMLETHRHYGVDFLLISQGPHLFHNFIRLLIGRHIHLVAKWSGRSEYEWPECKQDVQSRSDAVVRPYKLPAHVFKLYDSAEVHTKQDKRKPLSFYAAIAAVVLAVGILGFLYHRVSDRINPQSVRHQEQGGLINDPAGAGAQAPASAGASAAKSDELKIDTPERLAYALTPVVEGVPWSAPLYRDLVKPVAMPVVKGCIKSKSVDNPKCTCYTQQGTIVAMPFEACSSLVSRKVFNPFQPDKSSNDRPQVIASVN